MAPQGGQNYTSNHLRFRAFFIFSSARTPTAPEKARLVAGRPPGAINSWMSLEMGGPYLGWPTCPFLGDMGLFVANSAERDAPHRLARTSSRIFPHAAPGNPLLSLILSNRRILPKRLLLPTQLGL